MHDYDKLLRAALMTAHRYARGGYADRGFVDDAPDSVLMQEAYGNPITGEIVPMNDPGVQLSEPLRKAVENYAGNVGQAFHESGEYAKQGLENTVSDKGPLYNVSGPLQYMLGSAGQVFSPLTGAAMSAGQGATQLTGNPEFGNRVEFLGGLMDPSHIGMLKGAAAIPMAARTAAKAEEAAQAVALAKQQRELSPLGFYSHGAETAAGLQQAKGTPQQMAGVLRQTGVKPEEMFSAGFADEAATNALRSKIEAEFAPKVEAAQKAMEGLEPGTKEFQKAERQFKNISSTMRAEMDRALVLGEDWAARPSVTREEIAAHFKERMPQIEETVLGGKNLDLENLKAQRDAIDQKIEAFDVGTPQRKELAEQWRVLTNEIYTLERKAKPTKFGQYTIPGGENYREVLLKYAESPEQKMERAKSYVRPDIWEAMTDAQRQQYLSAPDKGLFKSQHWDDPNVLAHLRMADRTGPNGEKILHVEEIQSDWGQKGKKEGFAKEPIDVTSLEKANEEARVNAINANREMIERESGGRFNSLTNVLNSGEPELIARVRALRNSDPSLMEAQRQAVEAERALVEARNSNRSSVPVAPYVTNTQAWTDLALKRALREAAEGGYDKLVWTPGVEQAKRYDLSKQISRIGYQPETGTLYAVDTNGVRVPQLADKSYKPEELSGVIGKEATEKLLSTEQDRLGYHLLAGNDLSLGGEGMKGYYDKIVPNQLSKLVKKLDPEVKVGITDVMLPPKSGVGHNNPPLEAPGITITPKMRENILRGQTAFKRGGTIPFGPEAAQDAVRIAKQQAGRR